MLQTLAVASVAGVVGGVAAVWIEKKVSYFLRNSSAIMGGVEPRNVSHKQTIWELEPVSNAVTVESIKLLEAQENIKSEAVKLSDLWEITQKLNCFAQQYENLAQEVEVTWNNLLPDERNRLKKVAYELADKDSEDLNEGADSEKTSLLRIFLANPVEFFADLANLVSLAKKHKYRLIEVVSTYSEAKERLEAARYQFIDNILNAIERDDPQHQQFLSDTLKELKQTVAHSPNEQVVESEKISGWLSDLPKSDMEEF
jgi:hypothetical protein